MKEFGFFDPFKRNDRPITIQKTGEDGNTDIYTITYNDGDTIEFRVNNSNNEVEITTQTVEPTDERVELWVDLNGRTVLSIPQIDDNRTSLGDTWSSDKIQNELDTKMPITTKYAADIAMSITGDTFVLTTQLKDQDGNDIGHERTIDLPLETMVVNGSYDNETKIITLTLKNGQEIEVPIGDIIRGLQPEITPENPLDVDLVSGLYNFKDVKTEDGNIKTTITASNNSDALTFEAGEGIDLTGNSTTKKIKITNDRKEFTTVSVDGTSLTPNNTDSTLTINSGSNIKIDSCATTNTLTISGNYSTATSSSDGLMSKTDKDKLDKLKNFKTISANGTSVNADDEADTLTLTAGSNVQITGNDTTDTITISATDTTYNVATSSSDGLMSKDDKTKLDKIASYSSINYGNGSTQGFVQTNSANQPFTLLGKGSVTIELQNANTSSLYIGSNAEVNQNAFSIIAANGSNISATEKEDTLTLQAGNNIAITSRGKTIDISTAAEVNQNAFSYISIDGCSSLIAADSKTDTLNLIAGNNVTIAPNYSTDTLTFDSTDEKVKQTPVDELIFMPVVLTYASNLQEKIDQVYLSGKLTFSTRLATLDISSNDSANNANPPTISFTDTSTEPHKVVNLSTGAITDNIHLTLPQLSGTIALVSDINTYQGAGIEIDYANKTYKKLGTTAYDAMECFGGRRLCTLTRGGTGLDDVTIEQIESFTTAPTKEVVVKQPPTYYKVIATGTTRQLSDGCVVCDKVQYWVSDKPLAGYKLHPAFYYNGNQVKNIYHGAFPISSSGTGADGIAYYYGSYGVQPMTSKNRSNFRSYIKGIENYAINASLETIQTISLEQLLMLIEFGPNIQLNFSTGWTDITDDAVYCCAPKNGATFSTGTASNTGSKTLIDGSSVCVYGTQPSTSKGSCSYRGVENLLGGVWEFIDNMKIVNDSNCGKIYISDRSINNDSDITTNTNIVIPKTDGYLKTLGYSSSYDWILFPGEMGGDSGSGNIGDYYYQRYEANTDKVPLLGGCWDGGSSAGPFCWNVNDGLSAAYRTIGGRLVYFET